MKKFLLLIVFILFANPISAQECKNCETNKCTELMDFMYDKRATMYNVLNLSPVWFVIFSAFVGIGLKTLEASDAFKIFQSRRVDDLKTDLNAKYLNLNQDKQENQTGQTEQEKQENQDKQDKQESQAGQTEQEKQEKQENQDNQESQTGQAKRENQENNQQESAAEDQETGDAV